ncbi:hypothetical protein [Pseudonocardia nigra]|uniref:hypothetical protein n=1 Tax=Pseudonocardia nigra TaxID=1921578 RepID=UPI001C5D88A4|nr:hypothetical protein [Pseudonocardia nigra]
MDGEGLSFLGRKLGSSFVTRVVTIAPADSRPYVESEWRDALVVVECGEVDLECRAGGHRRFGRGAVLSLTGLGLRALHNTGLEPVVLVAVSRRAGGDGEIG